jgi:hypothetical protein
MKANDMSEGYSMSNKVISIKGGETDVELLLAD